MKRREFITLLGGAAVAWPPAGRVQQPMKLIGVLPPGSENDPELQTRVGALRKGLQDLGWAEGRNYRFEYRWPGTRRLCDRVGTADGSFWHSTASQPRLSNDCSLS